MGLSLSVIVWGLYLVCYFPHASRRKLIPTEKTDSGMIESLVETIANE